MEATKVQVSQHTLDLNKLTFAKKQALRKKLIVEYINSKPAGTVIRGPEFQEVGQFSTSANCFAFINRMIRDGLIQKHSDGRPRSFYYSSLGGVRVSKPATPETPALEVHADQDMNLEKVIVSMKQLGLHFTITISTGGSDETK